jgi:hypothetical protein
VAGASSCICTEVSDEQTLRAPKRLGKQLDSQGLLYKTERAGSRIGTGL